MWLVDMEPWVRSLAPHKMGIMAHACNPSTWGVGGGDREAEVQDCLQLLKSETRPSQKGGGGETTTYFMFLQ